MYKKSVHCILRTEDKWECDGTEEMVVSSTLGGDSNSWTHSGSSGNTGISTDRSDSRLICIPKPHFWLERHLNTTSLVVCVRSDQDGKTTANYRKCNRWSVSMTAEIITLATSNRILRFSWKQDLMLVLSVLSVNSRPNLRCAAIERESEENKL